MRITQFPGWLRARWERTTRRNRLWLTVGALIAGFVVIAAVRLLSQETPDEIAPALPSVTTRTLRELSQSTVVPVQAVVEPVSAAQLVARAGGRVTNIYAALGETVRAGSTVVEIDGRFEANPTHVQAAGLEKSLAILADIERAALHSAQLAVDLAESNLHLAQTNRPLQVETLVVGVDQAQLAVRQAELALDDARESGSDPAIRAADIALANAHLALEQAEIAQQLSVASERISDQQARLNVTTATAALTSTRARLAAERQQLATQVAVAREQVRLQQVISPLTGEVTRLTVEIGEYVAPGQAVGEVNAFAGARVRAMVAEGVREQLTTGQSVRIDATGQSFDGVVTSVASAPASANGLWQVDIFIQATPRPIHPGDIVTLQLPAGRTAADTFFVPLDALTVRQAGTVVFTVNPEGIVEEHAVEVRAFSGDFAEVFVALEDGARIVVEGNRRLTAGAQVAIRP